MKKNKFMSVLFLLPLAFSMIVACSDSDDDNDEPKTKETTVTLTSANLTDDGYFDGVMYYKITSNSPSEVSVVKAQNTVVNIVIPTKVIIDGKTHKCTSIEKYAFEDCTNLISVTIPNSVVSIGECAFDDCHGLTSITIPNSVTAIGKYAFVYCFGLTSVHCRCTTPPKLIYFSTHKIPTLYVPKGSLNAYQSNEYWLQSFENIVEE